MPAPSGADYFLLTLTDFTNQEIVKVTDNTANVLTVVRGYEGTAQAWDDGTVCQMNVTKDTLETLQLSASGVLDLPIIAKTAAYTVVVGDKGKIIDVDGTSAAFTITLPLAATAGDGFTVGFKKTDAVNSVTIDGDSAETIDGAATAVLASQYDSILLTCDGVEWHLVIKAGGGSGETNTASNGGTGGIGIVLTKSGVDLPFKSIAATSSKVVVTDDVGNSNVDIDIVEANIIHDNLSGAGTNTHAQVDTHIALTNEHLDWAADQGATDIHAGNYTNTSDHTALSNIGTNTHAQIDTHIANAANPHGVDIDDVTPTTTKGDIIVENGTNAIRVAVGTDGQVLEADSVEASGVKWATPSGGAGLPVDDATAIVKGSVDDTKLVRIEADGLTTATTRVITMPDNDVDLGTDFEPADGTILKDADIGVIVQAYDIDTTKNDVANTFTPAQTFSEIIASSKGISFPATQVPSADANTLDDYEKGTFTPTIFGVTTAGAPTYVTQVGFYTKNGDTVFAALKIAISAKGGMVGAIRISTLPFTANGTADYFGGVSTGLVSGAAITAGESFSGRVITGGDDIGLYLSDSTTGTSGLLDTDLGATFTIDLLATYKV